MDTKVLAQSPLGGRIMNNFVLISLCFCAFQIFCIKHALFGTLDGEECEY